jgi:hypothetical protein
VSEAEDEFGPVAPGGVQVPVDGGDLLGLGSREPGDDRHADRHVDADVGGLNAGAVQFLVQVDRPVAQGRGGGVDVADCGTGSMEPAPVVYSRVPAPASRIAGSTALVAAMAPYSWNSISCCTWDGSVSAGVVRAVEPSVPTGEYSSTSMPPNWAAASLSAWVSASRSSTSAGNAAVVMPSAVSVPTRPSSFSRLREIRATSKPWEPKVRAMASPSWGPAPTMAMLVTAKSFREDMAPEGRDLDRFIRISIRIGLSGLMPSPYHGTG